MSRDQRLESEWLDIVVSVLEDRTATDLPAELIAHQLITTLGADGCAYTSYDGATGSQMWPPEFWGGPDDYDNAEVAARESTGIHPIVQYYRALADPQPGATQIADVPARFHQDWENRGMDAFYRTLGVPNHLSMPLLGDSPRAFVLGRADVYSAAEMTSARVVHRLLRSLNTHVVMLRSVTGQGSDHAGPQDEILTPRQRVVLGLVARGMTAGAAGRRLGISESTVHKHLQNAYRTLDVNERLSAVTRARQLGVLPPVDT
jgi:DNA-binding CsgD family transcriptional regulator